MHAQSLSCVWLFATSWTIAHQAPLSVEFSREECWSGLPFPSSGGLVSCVSYTGRWFFTTESPGKTLEIVAYLATWCEELTHWKRLWCWEGLGAREVDDRGWDGWMASPTRWTWVWVNSGSWWWTGRPGLLQFMGLQRVGHGWATELTELNEIMFMSYILSCLICIPGLRIRNQQCF